MAAANRIEDEDRAFEAAEVAFPKIVRGDIAPTEADEQCLAVPDPSSMAQDVFNISIRQISLSEALVRVDGD